MDPFLRFFKIMSFVSNVFSNEINMPLTSPAYHNVDEAAEQVARRLIAFASEIFKEHPDLVFEEEIEDSDIEEIVDDFYGKDVEKPKPISPMKSLRFIPSDSDLSAAAAPPVLQTAHQVDRTAGPTFQNTALSYNMDAVLYETTGLCLIQ